MKFSSANFYDFPSTLNKPKVIPLVLYSIYNFQSGDLNFIKLKNSSLRVLKLTFVGSKLTKPQAHTTTPLHLCEMATIPTESGTSW